MAISKSAAVQSAEQQFEKPRQGLPFVRCLFCSIYFHVYVPGILFLFQVFFFIFRAVFNFQKEQPYRIEFTSEKKFSFDVNDTAGTTGYYEETEPGK